MKKALILSAAVYMLLLLLLAGLWLREKRSFRRLEQKQHEAAEAYESSLELRDQEAERSMTETEENEKQETEASAYTIVLPGPDTAGEEEKDTSDTAGALTGSAPASKETEAYFPVTEDLHEYVRDGRTFGPEDAFGKTDCILSVPSAGILRPVYKGTTEEITHDLDLWFTVAARPEYRLGSTHYVIYGHNHTAQELSFNHLREVKPGEHFYLKHEGGVYDYLITQVYPEWREKAAEEIVDNFGISPDYCYILTCGRDDFRYRDLVVVGRRSPGEPVTDAAEESHESNTELRISGSGRELYVSLLADGRMTEGAELAFFDADGMLLREDDGSPRTFRTGEEAVRIPLPEQGNYVLGVLSMPEKDLPAPEPIGFSVSAKGKVRTGEEGGRSALSPERLGELPPSFRTVLLLLCISLLWLLLLLVRFLFFGKRERDK